MPRLERNVFLFQFRGGRGPACVGDKHRIAATVQQSRCGDPTSCHANDEDHTYLNFNVDKLNNAKINAAIQKRMMTFDSFQPFNSK